MPLPNTVTTPQQGRIQRLLALQRQPEEVVPPGVVDIEPGIEPATMALLHGLTNAKSEYQAKETATKIVNLPHPQITTTVDPSTGRTIVNAKNLVLGGDPQQEVQDAYDQPQNELIETIRPHLQARGLPMPGPNGQIAPDIAEKLNSWRGRYQVARMLGKNPLDAFITTTGISARPGAWEESEAQKLGDLANRKRITKGIKLAKWDSRVLSDARAERRLDLQEQRAVETFNKNATEFDRAQRSEIAKTIQSTPFAYLPEGTDPYQYAAQAAGLPSLPDHLKPLVDANIAISAIERRKAEQEEARKAEDQEFQRKGLELRALATQLQNDALRERLALSLESNALARDRFEHSKTVQQGKPATEGQRKAFDFYIQARDASDALLAVEDEVVKYSLAGQARLKYAPNPLQTDTDQLYNQARRQFTEARLRQKSGAAIAQSEYENDNRIYFAQPGDSKATLERKRAARKKVLEGLVGMAGPAYDEVYGRGQRTSATTAVPSLKGKSNEELFRVLTGEPK